jgi:ribonuclease HI
VERFPKELEAALKRAKEEGAGIARYQAKVKAELAEREFASETEIYQMKIKVLDEETANQKVQIERLSQQVEAMLKQAQELAVKAIEGSSSHSSFQALKEIALEQAKNQLKTK